MIESILVEDESSMLFSTGKLPEKQVFLCNRKFLGIPYYTKRHILFQVYSEISQSIKFLDFMPS